MRKIFTLVLMASLIPVSLFAQEQKEEPGYNRLYVPRSLIQRLSYENYRDIKLLNSAIINFGGGEAEFDRLIEGYADASTLYFANKIEGAATAFTKNEKDIRQAGLKVAAAYKQDAEKIHMDMIKLNIKTKIKMELNGDQQHKAIDRVLAEANECMRLAEDNYERSRPATAIYYYRRAKEKCFEYYTLMNIPIPEEYQKHVVDNRNQIYVAKVKEK